MNNDRYTVKLLFDEVSWGTKINRIIMEFDIGK